MTIDELADYLVAQGLATPATVIGCTPDEVAQARVALGVDELPEQYEQFLLRMGRACGDLLLGTDLCYPWMVRLADEMPDMLEETGIGAVVEPSATFVAQHCGYQLYWLSRDGTAHFADEGRDNPVRSWPSLVDCLKWEADRQLAMRRSRAT